MIILEILLRPIPSKYLELSQSLEAIHDDLHQLCAHLTISKQEQSFLFISIFNTMREFVTMLESDEARVLSGAISMLTDENRHTTTHNGSQKKWESLGKMRDHYLVKKAN